MLADLPDSAGLEGGQGSGRCYRWWPWQGENRNVASCPGGWVDDLPLREGSTNLLMSHRSRLRVTVFQCFACQIATALDGVISQEGIARSM